MPILRVVMGMACHSSPPAASIGDRLLMMEHSVYFHKSKAGARPAARRSRPLEGGWGVRGHVAQERIGGSRRPAGLSGEASTSSGRPSEVPATSARRNLQKRFVTTTFVRNSSGSVLRAFALRRGRY